MQILKTEKDKKVFFNAILSPAKPNTKLVEAAKRFKEFKKVNT